jgi:hypothetical protein
VAAVILSSELTVSITVGVAATALMVDLPTALAFFAASVSFTISVLYPFPTGKLLGHDCEWWPA